MNDIDELRDIMSILDKHKAIPLSNTDIMKLVDGKANVLLYRELHKFMFIEDLFGPHDACFLLYESKPNYGHWTCLTIRDQFTKNGELLDKKMLEFFDPYGGFPDSQLQYIPADFRRDSHQDDKYLNNLLYEAADRYSLSYNEFQFQELKSGVADCGRWCAVRIMLKELPLKDFKNLFLNVYSDDLVTFVTLPEEEFTEKSIKVI